MNSLFLAGLTLFFAQGFMGRDKWSAKLLAAIVSAGLAVAFAYSLADG